LSVAAASLLEQATRAKPELVERLLRLTAVDAPSSDLAALRRAADAFAEELGSLGGAVERHERSGIVHLSTQFGPGDGARHVLVLCHYDTVWPAGTAAERPARVTDGRLSGPGVFDMRGGIVSALGALRLLGEERLATPVRVLLTGDEETGAESSQELIAEFARDAALVLVTEPPLPGGSLKSARKGWATYTIRAEGRPAHSGLDPYGGVSAIEELMDQLLDVLALRDRDSGTTVNVGTIEGGSRINVVAAEASAVVEVRAATVAEQRRVDEALHELRARRPGASVTVTRHQMRPPMERTAAIAGAVARAQKHARSLGFDLGEGVAGGTSDANLIAPLGVPLLDGLGPEGGGAHALDEHILVESLAQRTALIALLIAGASA
jgi:glutamate carboxypeptidase